LKNPNFLIIILGPTGVGKTELSVFLARKYDAEIFSADARQFFKELNIGTAKPSKEALASVKHHFIDSLSIHACYSVGKFEEAVIEKLDNYFQQKDIAIIATVNKGGALALKLTAKKAAISAEIWAVSMEKPYIE